MPRRWPRKSASIATLNPSAIAANARKSTITLRLAWRFVIILYRAYRLYRFILGIDI